MPHLSLQLSASIVVPFAIGGCRSTRRTRFKPIRSIREIAALEAGLLPAHRTVRSPHRHAPSLPAIKPRRIDESED